MYCISLCVLHPKIFFLEPDRAAESSDIFVIFISTSVCSSLESPYRLNSDAIHISKDSGLTMGMAVCSVCRAALKLSGMFGLLVVKHNQRSSRALLPASVRFVYCNTWPLVSGNFVARKLPAASAPAANMMGTALVMPTNDWKMLMPRTAASLQRAFRKPNAVVLKTRREREKSFSNSEFSL